MSERLEALARRVANDPDFLAYSLAAYAGGEQLSDAELARRLGCLPGQLAAIRLCRTPRSEAPHFQQDVDRIAAHFLIDGDVIAAAVRLADSLAALRQINETSDGYLAAARDREEEDARVAEDQDESP